MGRLLTLRSKLRGRLLKKMENKKKIIFSGGGTLGSVVPLLAIYQNLIKLGYQKEDFLWVGTTNGPEKEFIENYGLKFKSINSSKLRRYFAWQNFIDFLYLIIGFIESLVIVLNFKPNLIISAGSFVSVPVAWAGRLFGKKIIIHQQDFRPGLANKIMAPVADKITVTFEKSLKDFDQNKVIWIGNPVREEILKTYNLKLKTQNYEKFNLVEDKPVLLILGGGTGALGINQVVVEVLAELTKFCQIIHLTGKGKLIPSEDFPGYRAYEFLNEELPLAVKLAKVVISRTGMSTLTELSYLNKPTIVIPLPNSHQEENAKYFSDREAVIYLKQNELTKEKLINTIKGLLTDREKREKLGDNFRDSMKQGAGEEMVKIIKGLINKD